MRNDDHDSPEHHDPVVSLDFLGEDLEGADPVADVAAAESLTERLAMMPPPATTTAAGDALSDPLAEAPDAAPAPPDDEDNAAATSAAAWVDEDADDDAQGQLDAQPVMQLLASAPPPSASATPHIAHPPVSAASPASDVREAAISWASRWEVSDDPYITGLIDAIDDRENLTSWAAMDPHELLPYPESRRGRGLRRLTRVILVLRNVTVFIPVALTWLAINKATAAYGPYLESLDPEQTASVSFLEFWQSGGSDGSALDRFWRIQHIAFLGAIIIAGIVAATLLASTLEARSRVRSQRQEATMELERRALALEIAVGLQGSKSATPESITEALALALGDLLQAARDVGAAAARMETASVGIDSLTPRIADLNIHAAALGRSLTNDVNKAIDDLGRSVSTLGVTLGGDMQRFLTDVLVGLEEINDRLNRTSVSVEFGTKQLRDDLDAMHGSLSQLTGRRS